VVGNGHGLHFVVGSRLEQIVQAERTIQKAELRVKVEMSKIGVQVVALTGSAGLKPNS
jgi:hypothetical protein